MRRRYVQIDGELQEVPLDWAAEPRRSAEIMPDIEPYRSMIDGSMISSRSQHREHLRRHGCVEVGNDSSVVNARPQPLKSPPGLKETIAREVYRRLRY